MTILPISPYFLKVMSDCLINHWFFSQIVMMNGYFCSEGSLDDDLGLDESKLLWQKRGEIFLPFYIFFSVPASRYLTPTSFQCSVCAAVSRPDLGTDFYSNTFVWFKFSWELHDPAAVPADAVWPRLGFYCRLVFTVCLSTSIIQIWFLSLFPFSTC